MSKATPNFAPSKKQKQTTFQRKLARLWQGFASSLPGRGGCEPSLAFSTLTSFFEYAWDHDSSVFLVPPKRIDTDSWIRVFLLAGFTPDSIASAWEIFGEWGSKYTNMWGDIDSPVTE